MIILVVNAGSSSLKYQVIDTNGEKMLAKGTVGNIGIDNGYIKHTKGAESIKYVEQVADHVQAIKRVLEILKSADWGVIADVAQIDAVGHRVLHGGKKFSGSVLITEQVKDAIRECIPLGPLHNPANLMGIEACEKVMTGKPQVAVFDTAFHQTMPRKAYMYGVPKMYEEKLGVRRYGFHGTSHRYVSQRVLEFTGESAEGQKIIVCHLGNGSSLSAVVDGKCVDTSMGLTPLEGLLMGTRCGSCDPAVVQFIANHPLDKKGNPIDGTMSVDDVLTLMNKESGLLGISGLSSDMQVVDKNANEGHADALLARDMLVYSIKKHIGMYAAAMGGVTKIVFTGGIGENNQIVRRQVMENMEYMGVKFDDAKNLACRDGAAFECCISADDSAVGVYVIPTNEELVIARDTMEICSPKN